VKEHPMGVTRHLARFASRFSRAAPPAEAALGFEQAR